MVKKLVCVIVIAILLFGLAITETVLIENLLIDIDDKIDHLLVEYEVNKEDVTVTIPEIEKIKNEWDEAENALCLMFNHKDMSSVTDCISRLLSFTKINNYDDGIVELRLLKEYSEKNPHIMGCNIHNIL